MLSSAGLVAPRTQRAPTFLDQLGGTLFKVPEGVQVDPRVLQQQQQQALLTLGLGMLAGKEQGRGFGESALRGLGAAQGGFQGALQQGYANTMANRREAREDTRMARDEERYQADRAYAMERDRMADERQARADDLRQRELEQMGEVRSAQAAASRSGAASEAAARRQAAEADARVRVLMAKPDRTPEEDLELDSLTRGAVSRMMRAQNSGLGMFGGFGGVPGYAGGTFMGPMAGANPLLNDPDL